MSNTDKKRDDFPSKHRDSGSGFGSSSSRSRDDSRSHKRDDYDSPKRDRRDNSDYKRDSGYNKSRGGDLNDLPPRHSSSSTGGGNYNMGPSSHGRDSNADMIIMKPYMDQAGGGGRGGSSDFRRSNMQTSNNLNNVTLIGGSGNTSGGSGMPSMVMKDERSRYIDSGPQNDLRYGGGSDRGMWNNSSGPVPVKPFGTVQIQNDNWSQDRYDRTYNERKSPYLEPVRQSSGSSVSFINRPQDRYNSRFDNGRF